MQIIVMNVILLILLIKMMIEFEISMRKLIKTEKCLNIWIVYFLLIITVKILSSIMIPIPNLNSTFGIMNTNVIIGLSMFITNRIMYFIINYMLINKK